MQDDTPIFEQVTEEEYNAIAQRNMRDNDFIVDDNGEGYVDQGLEDWDNVSMDSESSDDENDETSKGIATLFFCYSLSSTEWMSQ